MKINLDVVTTTTTEYDVEFPVYLQEGSNYYCFFDPSNLKRSIKIDDYLICKGVSYDIDFTGLKAVLQNQNSKHITKEMFQNKLVEILKIINGAVDEMHKADEQQQGD